MKDIAFTFTGIGTGKPAVVPAKIPVDITVTAKKKILGNDTTRIRFEVPIEGITNIIAGVVDLNVDFNAKPAPQPKEDAESTKKKESDESEASPPKKRIIR